MTNPTRALAQRLRADPTIAQAHQAAAAIDALLDAIEAGGMVQPRPAPVMDLGPLRELRAWHNQSAVDFADMPMRRRGHLEAVAILNQYFPEGDRL